MHQAPSNIPTSFFPNTSETFQSFLKRNAWLLNARSQSWQIIAATYHKPEMQRFWICWQYWQPGSVNPLPRRPGGLAQCILAGEGKRSVLFGEFLGTKMDTNLRNEQKFTEKSRTEESIFNASNKKDRKEGFKKARLRDNNDADADIFPPTLTPTSTTFAFTSPTWYTYLFHLFLVVFFLFWYGEG